MIKEVDYPPHLFRGITPLLKDYPIGGNIHVFGGDTETVRGRPDSLQLCGPEDEGFFYVDQDTIFLEFWKWIFPRLRKKGVNLCYFHNLSFDLRILFVLHHKSIYEQNNNIHLELDDFGHEVKDGSIDVKMIYGKVNKATLSQAGTTVHLLDSKAFTQASLARSIKMFKVDQPKLKAPAGLGERKIRSKEFVEYAMQDARVVRALGLRIMEFHKLYAIAPSISLPSFGARIFRRHFIKPNEVIPFPPLEIVKAAELSYHGGKNGYYFNKPKIIEDVYEIDISSAYPFAMSEMPPMTKGDFCKVDRYDPAYVGIYKVSGQSPIGYSLLYDHGFREINPGSEFQDIWITCYEVEILKKYGRIDSIEGYAWLPGAGATNPMRRYIDHFYAKKQSHAKDDPFYQLFKIAMNALYGKFLSCIEQITDELREEIRRLQESGVDIPDNFIVNERWDEVLCRYVKLKRQWRAGSVYNPFWGSLITGHCRAYLYRLERELNAIHSATDSVKTTTYKPAQAGLGGLKVECFGRCYFFDNKLYLHCSKDFEYCGHSLQNPENFPGGKPVYDHDGQHLCKVAKHGFKGDLFLLWNKRHALIAGRKVRYSYKHCVGLREGMRKKERPGDFVDRPETLDLLGGRYAESGKRRGLKFDVPEVQGTSNIL